VSSVRYELGFYIPEDGILHSSRSENLRYLLNTPTAHLDVDNSVLSIHLFVEKLSTAAVTQCGMILTPRNSVLLEKLPVVQLLKKFPTSYGTSSFITLKNGVLWDVTPCGSCKNRR
jgi:hypothetical protein